MCVCVCVCARACERGRGQKQPLLCLQEQELAAEERKEKRLEDCVWNCPSVAVVVLSHFISATAAFFPPSICPATILPPSQSRKNTHSLTMDGSTQSPTFFFPPTT